MLTVACVLRLGGIYDAAWVGRLRAGVTRHLPIEHRFVCLSDVDVPCERIPLENNWPGWWSKIELFKLPGPVLYFDLDTVIVGDLSAIASWPLRGGTDSGGISALRDFYRPAGLGSGVMTWGRSTLPLYGFFRMEAEANMRILGARGDQGYLEDFPMVVSRLQDHVEGIVSYKVHCRAGIPEGARVVCLHGLPKFADMPANDPVRLAWERAA